MEGLGMSQTGEVTEKATEKTKEFYQGKRVFLTGHTGFKGTWLAWWLKRMGAEVTGYALAPEKDRPSLFELTQLQSEVQSVEADLRDYAKLKTSLEASQPQIVFHLAAQALVLDSYQDPRGTYETNVMGTINLLDAIREVPSVRSVVVVTTDKCYDNQEWLWPYRETDALGGKDPYSSSKAMAELAASAYRQSFFNERADFGLATARAGNVIGGGDFARYRIIPDIVAALGKKQPVVLRHPQAVRPWQHVLDALHGYLQLGQKLWQEPNRFSSAFNFSTLDNSKDHTVQYVTEKFIHILGFGEYQIDPQTRLAPEAHLLQLDSSKARAELGWQPQLLTDQAIEFTVDWYKSYLSQSSADSLREITFSQIQKFLNGREQ